MPTKPQISLKKKYIKNFYETNDKEGMKLALLWDTLKAVLQGKFIMESSRLKEKRNGLQEKVENKIKSLLEQHKKS